MLYPINMTKDSQLKYISALGFKTVINKTYENINEEILNKVITRRRKFSLYDIDGIIINDNNLHVANSSGNPDYAFA